MNPLPRIQMVVHLQAMDLFAYCNAEQMVRIAGIARQQLFRRGERIYARNDPAEALYCVIDGRVRLESPHGEPRAVGVRGTFGGEEILSDRLRAEDARAETDAVVLAIDADDFFDLLSNNIEIVKALFRQLLRQPRQRPSGRDVSGQVSDQDADQASNRAPSSGGSSGQVPSGRAASRLRTAANRS